MENNPKKNTKQVISWVLVSLLLVASVFLVYKNFIAQPPLEGTLSPRSDNTLTSIDENADYLISQEDQQIFDYVFNNSEKYGIWSIDTGTPGRSNPFIPLD